MIKSNKQVQSWEVAEINIIRLPTSTTEEELKEFCKGYDCQIVKVTLDNDPISGQCKGRGRIILRYNPDHNGLSTLVADIKGRGWAIL